MNPHQAIFEQDAKYMKAVQAFINFSVQEGYLSQEEADGMTAYQKKLYFEKGNDHANANE